MTKQKATNLIQAKTFQILRSSDAKCFIYQHWVKGGTNPKTQEKVEDHWSTIGYYGKLSDLVIYLLNRHIEVPKGTLENQMKDLLIEIKRIEKSILSQLTEAEKEKI